MQDAKRQGLRARLGGYRWLAATLAGGMAGLACVSQLAMSQGAVPAVPVAPSNVVAAKAYGTLERSCARCHQAGMLEGQAPAARFGNVLALGEIARDPALVRPGIPDASRIYNIALTRELHLDVFNDPGVHEPAALDVQALRDWIAELPDQPGGACRQRVKMHRGHLDALIDNALAAMPPERARQTRFLSLAHLHNACLTDAELDALRSGLVTLLAGLMPRTSSLPSASAPRALAAVAGSERLVYAVSLTALGWRPEQWNALVAAYPLIFTSTTGNAGRGPAEAATARSVWLSTGTPAALVHADWFADAALNNAPGTDFSGFGPNLWGLPGPLALAHAWRRPADLQRVLADLLVSDASAVTAALRAAAGDLVLPAHQLLSGAVARRPALDQLYRVLGKVPPAEQPNIATGEGRPFEIALTSDKAVYKVGDTAVLTALSNRDCYLTVIDVDRGGRGTVLFPNEIEPDNRVQAGHPRRVPSEGAHYRFRFKDAGRETIVAACSQSHKSPEGIVHDYDRLRFTVLGDWQLFLREPPEMGQARRDDAATDVPRPPATPRQRSPAQKQGSSPAGPDVQTRTAITVVVE